MDSSVLAVVVLFATVLLRVALIATVIWLLIPRRTKCPHCSAAPDRLVTAGLLRAIQLERRWCLACGWVGISKRLRRVPGRARRAPAPPMAPLAVALLVVAAACESPDDDFEEVFGSAQWVDLTHPFNDETLYWPTAEPFQLEELTRGLTEAGYYYTANNLSGAEHGGTHLDAPIHFAEGKHTTDQIPVSQLVGPAVVVDISAQTATNADYLVTVSDLEAFEAAHGTIPGGAIVLFRTGWGARWPNRAAYLGTDLEGDAAIPQLHFPGIDSSAARWLVTQRSINAVGIDTPSIDYGQSAMFETHQTLFAANIPAFENVANLNQLPEVGAYVIALPMKIEGGTGGPLRIVGVLPERD